MVGSYQPKAVVVDAETFDPSPENIEKRVHRLDIAGMKIALLSKKNRGETVFFTMTMPAGDEKTLFGQDEIGDLTGAMMSMGTTRYTREQLRDEFAKLKVSGRVAGPGASFQTTRSNIVAAIALAAHVLREPSFPADEFEQLKKLMVTSIESQLSDPEAKASEAIDRQFNIYPIGDPRYAPTMQESMDGIKAVTLDDVKRYHRTFYAANRAQFAIVGDFNEEEVIKAIQDGFANWRNDTPWKRITRDYRDIPAKTITIETPDKENAVLMARMNIDVNQNDPDYAALQLADYIFGGAAGFDSRLTARIRVKEGLSYGVGSQAAGSIFDRRRHLDGGSIRRAAEHGEGGSRAGRGNPEGAQGWLHGGGNRQGQVRLGATVRAEPRAGPDPGRPAAVASRCRSHLPDLGQGFRDAHAGCHR